MLTIYGKKKEDIKADAGRIKFTKFKQAGKLNLCGEGYCSIKGEFEITFKKQNPLGATIEIKKGKFYVPKSRYWDSRAMED